MKYLKFIICFALLMTGCEDFRGEDDLKNLDRVNIVDLREDCQDQDYLITDGASIITFKVDNNSNKPTYATLYDPVNKAYCNISFDSLGRPSLYKIENVIIELSNYRDNLVDITISIDDDTICIKDCESSVNWDDGFYSLWNSQVTSRSIDWDRLGDCFADSFSPIGIGIGYGLKSIGDFATILLDREANVLDKLDALASISNNLADAILEVVPASKSTIRFKEYINMLDAGHTLLEECENFKYKDWKKYDNPTEAKKMFFIDVIDQMGTILSDSVIEFSRITEPIETFVANFFSDSSFQLSRINFPVGGAYDGFDDETIPFTEYNWKFIEIPPVPLDRVNDNKYTADWSSDGGACGASLTLERLNNRKWYLTHYDTFNL